MSLTFSDTLANDLATVFLNQNEFAERVTVQAPGSTTTRVITAVVDMMRQPADDDHFAQSLERVKVLLSRDQSNADTRPFVFQGDISSASAEAYEAVFQRELISREGLR